MLTQELYQHCLAVFASTFQPRVPYTPQSGNVMGKFRRASTGTMRRDASKVEIIDKHVVKVFVDASISPYVVYTNEPWLSPKWKGAKNPNEGWFERATERFAQELAASLGGTLEIVKGTTR